MSKTAQPPDASVWQAQSLRLVAFPETSPVAHKREWWEELVGTQPETLLRRGTTQEEAGVWEAASLTVSVNPVLIQWSVAPPLDLENLGKGPRLLGPFRDRTTHFTELMERWLTLANLPLKRLAFVASLAQPADDHAAGYKTLSSYLPDVKLDPRSSDFLYRINRRRRSREIPANLDINRLTSWYVAKLVTSFGAGTPEGVTMVDKEEHTYCVLEMDINTMAEYLGVFPQEKLASLLRELAAIADEIASKGDVP